MISEKIIHDKDAIELGSFDRVVLDKMFGPTIFANIRIYVDVDRMGWVIERQVDEFTEWSEEAFIEAQRESDFNKQDD